VGGKIGKQYPHRCPAKPMFILRLQKQVGLLELIFHSLVFFAEVLRMLLIENLDDHQEEVCGYSIEDFQFHFVRASKGL